mmetsp:Transcript_13263/g.33617  ORF Transcript_13263/g.33617 Transcript_13263/m.33617 type:complete len:93 (-) Transcript_13263:101-379(-)
MDMTEEIAMENSQRRILFSMFESRDFAKFEGVWHMTPLGEKCRLRYEVEIQPRGLIPVKAIEWRIKKDLPGNLIAVKSKTESLTEADLREAE